MVGMDGASTNAGQLDGAVRDDAGAGLATWSSGAAVNDSTWHLVTRDPQRHDLAALHGRDVAGDGHRLVRRDHDRHAQPRPRGALGAGQLHHAHLHERRYYLAGSLDEARASNVARDLDWVTTDYNNQNVADRLSSRATRPGRRRQRRGHDELDHLRRSPARWTRRRPAQGTTIAWQMAQGFDTLGFNVFRETNGARVKLNDALIPAQALSGGGGRALFVRRPGAAPLRDASTGSRTSRSRWTAGGTAPSRRSRRRTARRSRCRRSGPPGRSDRQPIRRRGPRRPARAPATSSAAAPSRPRAVAVQPRAPARAGGAGAGGVSVAGGGHDRRDASGGAENLALRGPAIPTLDAAMIVPRRSERLRAAAASATRRFVVPVRAGVGDLEAIFTMNARRRRDLDAHRRRDDASTSWRARVVARVRGRREAEAAADVAAFVELLAVEGPRRRRRSAPSMKRRQRSATATWSPALHKRARGGRLPINGDDRAHPPLPARLRPLLQQPAGRRSRGARRASFRPTSSGGSSTRWPTRAACGCCSRAARSSRAQDFLDIYKHAKSARLPHHPVHERHPDHRRRSPTRWPTGGRSPSRSPSTAARARPTSA